MQLQRSLCRESRGVSLEAMLAGTRRTQGTRGPHYRQLSTARYSSCSWCSWCSSCSLYSSLLGLKRGQGILGLVVVPARTQLIPQADRSLPFYPAGNDFSPYFSVALVMAEYLPTSIGRNPHGCPTR